MINFIKAFLSLCLLLSMALWVIKTCIDDLEEKEERIHQCFLQEPRTKECEYILWKESKLRLKNQDDDFVTGMLLGQAMSGGLK